MRKKPTSAKARAAKAKREKIDSTFDPNSEIDPTIDEIDAKIPDAVRQRMEDEFERAWGARSYPNDTGWVDRSYPSTASLEESDFLTAEEAAAQEEQLLGKRGVPELDDPMPAFLQASAKAGPPASDTPLLDHLGRTPKERERKIIDAIALGEKSLNDNNLPAVVMAGAPEKPRRTVTILRDHDLEYPDLYMSVYIAGDWGVPDDEARFAKWLVRSGCYKADEIDDADLVLFGGGSDVEPLLYGESNENMHPSVWFNSERDAADMQIYLKARQNGTPMMGVCRGAQFLHVMNGGKLYQDIDGHQGSHKAFALKEKLLIESVSSVHHQQCIHNNDMEVLLTSAGLGTVRWLNKHDKDKSAKVDIEAFYYRDTGCFGVQGHPEYSGCNKFSVWCLQQLNDLFLCSPDFTWDGKRLTMTPSARDASKIASAYIENAYNQSKEV